MDVTRRAFLKAATIAASMTSLLPFGKAAEQRKEKRAIQWNWRVGDWVDKQRLWETEVELPGYIQGFYVTLFQYLQTTNEKEFCGIWIDHLRLSRVSWATGPDRTTCSVCLTERRTAQGYVYTLDAVTGRADRFRCYNRSNFQKIMPGQHSFAPKPTVAPQGDLLVEARELSIRLLGPTEA